MLDGKAYLFTGDSGEIITEVPVPAAQKEELATAQRLLVEALADGDDEIGEAFLMEVMPTPEQAWLSSRSKPGHALPFR